MELPGHGVALRMPGPGLLEAGSLCSFQAAPCTRHVGSTSGGQKTEGKGGKSGAQSNQEIAGQSYQDSQRKASALLQVNLRLEKFRNPRRQSRVEAAVGPGSSSSRPDTSTTSRPEVSSFGPGSGSVSWRILFLSNGHGEDTIAASIIRAAQVKTGPIRKQVYCEGRSHKKTGRIQGTQQRPSGRLAFFRLRVTRGLPYTWFRT